MRLLAWLRSLLGSVGDVALVFFFMSCMSALGFFCLIVAALVKNTWSEAITVIVSGFVAVHSVVSSIPGRYNIVL
jgi:hypothetical protein